MICLSESSMQTIPSLEPAAVVPRIKLRVDVTPENGLWPVGAIVIIPDLEIAFELKPAAILNRIRGKRLVLGHYVFTIVEVSRVLAGQHRRPEPSDKAFAYFFFVALCFAAWWFAAHRQ